MQPVSQAFLDARSRGGRRVRRVFLSTRSGPWVEIPFTDYRIDATRGDRVVARFSGTVTLPPSVSPSQIDEYGTRVQVRAGFAVGDGEELVTLATLTVYDVDQTDHGQLTLTGYSVERAVEDAQFRSAYTLPRGFCVAALRTLLGVVPVTVSVRTLANPPVPTAVYDADRWGAVQDIAAAMSVDVVADPFGGFAVMDVPTLTDATPVFTMGVIPQWAEKRTREGSFSVVVVQSSQAQTGSVVPRGVWQDDVPTSPTYYRGPFGEVVNRVQNPLMVTDAQCAKAAQTMGRNSRGLSRSLSLSGLPADFLEPGDVIRVTRPDTGASESHIVDGLSHSALGTQPLKTRTTQGIF